MNNNFKNTLELSCPLRLGHIKYFQEITSPFMVYEIIQN